MESSRSNGGAALPPRKRLLAGLKQNGWFSSGEKSFKANGDENRDCEDSERCTTCGVKDEEDSVKVKSGNRFVSLCKLCSVSLNSGEICCYCFRRISNDMDTSVVLSCCQCGHRAHYDCIHKQNNSVNNNNNPVNVSFDTTCFVCMDSSLGRLPSEAANRRRAEAPGLGLGLGFDGRDKDGLGLGLGLAAGCNSDGGACASSVCAAADSVVFSVDKTLGLESSVHKLLGKKPLTDVCNPLEACCSTTDSRAVDGSREGNGNSVFRKFEHLLKSQHSPKELVEKAEAEVRRTTEAAGVAKAVASRKTAEAFELAAVAKEALKIVADTTQEEKKKENKAVVRKKCLLSKQSINKVADRQSKIEEAEAKRGVAAALTASVVDDEELARRLHRAINSSPRISRNTVGLGETDPEKLKEPDLSRAHYQRPGLSKQQTRLRSPFLKKQEEKLQNKSESVNWGKVAHKTEPGSQSACGKFGGSPIDKLLQTLDHSETESSVGLLALNQDPSVHKPIAEAKMRGSNNGGKAQVSSAGYDEKASDAGRVLKELGVCNYSQLVEPEVGNLEKLAETVAVVIEEENSRNEEDKLDVCIKEEAASCSTKPIEPAGTHQSPEPGEETSQKQGGVRRKKPYLDLLKTNEFRIRSSKSKRTLDCAGNFHGSVAIHTKGSPVSDDSSVRLHGRRSNARSNSERRTKSISGDFPQESQGSARGISTRHQDLHQDILKPSQSFAGSVNLVRVHSASQVPLQSPAFASGVAHKHSYLMQE